ncbi:hypothetical protein [Acinetobacter radioresistens]|uniref:hypothetical protein n=1 Tax=Acinetobacter radioresistens TaxID=40216 RepID=UPI0021CD669E|nr:hypothetical protein [Acinetobacter radioresistens]
MFNKLALGVVLGLALINSSFASESTERAQVMKTMTNYISSVACENEKLDPKNIFTIDRDIDSGIGTYYVLWTGDKGCMGGSGTISSYVSEVSRYSNNRPFLVMNDDAFNNEKNWKYDSEDNVISAGINFRFIESIRKINSDSFSIIAWNYADDKFGGKDGGNNFPANRFKYTLKKLEGTGWVITNQVLLEQNK